MQLTTMSAHADLPADDSVTSQSKTQRKHAMQALQDLGAALVALDPKRLATLDLPEQLVSPVNQPLLVGEDLREAQAQQVVDRWRQSDGRQKDPPRPT